MKGINIESMIRKYFKKVKELKDQKLKLIEIKKKIEEYKELLNLKFVVIYSWSFNLIMKNHPLV